MNKLNVVALFSLFVAAGCAAEAAPPSQASSDAVVGESRARRFVGTWTFDETSQVTIACPNAAVIVTPLAHTNLVLEVGADGTLRGTSSIGCHYTYSVEGSTATLTPGQVCHVPDGQGGTTEERLDHDVLTLTEDGGLTLEATGSIGPHGVCVLTVVGSLRSVAR